MPPAVKTGNALVDQYFQMLDAKIADESTPALDRALLRRVRPELVKDALDDPENFEREFRELMRGFGVG